MSALTGHPLLALLHRLHEIGSREDEKAAAQSSATPHTGAAAAPSPAHGVLLLSALLPPQSLSPRPSYFALYARERPRRLAALLV